MAISHSDLARLCAEAYKIDEVNKGQDFAFYTNNDDTLIVILKGSTVGEEGLTSSRQWQENVTMLAPDLYNGAANALNYFGGWKLPVLTGESYYSTKERFNSSNKNSSKALTDLILKEVKEGTKSVVFTGHSRGGMMAIQCAVNVHFALPTLNISVVTFAAPIMTMTTEEIAYLKDKTVCYKHIQDPVIMLDVGGGADLAGFKTIVIANNADTIVGAHAIETYIVGVEATESVKATADHLQLVFDTFSRCQ